jgi:hypothetical protein
MGQHKCLTGLVALLVALPASAADFYVAPDGDDDALGTEGAPFATAGRAEDAATPGDTVFFRGGTYLFTGDADIGVLFDKDGEPDRPIRYFAVPGEIPVFDFFQLTPQARIRGFSVRANWLHFRGLELRGVQQTLVDQNESWGIRVENGASDNIFEQLDIHHNEGPGLFINDGGNNLVLNVDSHHNWDPDRGGENSDGFGCHSNDAGNVFRGCRAFRNSDDGFDFINAPGVCVVESSWAFYNGYIPDTFTAEGNGNGIKAGGFGLDPNTFPGVVPRHVVRFNVAFGNLAAGFYSNHHPGGIDWLSNTAFDNARNFDLLADVGAASHFLRNNLAVAPGTALARATPSEIDDGFNSWSLPVTVSEADFASLAEELATAPRQADGSLPRVDFLRLAAGSDLIDRGEDRGFPFNDAAPELGAFETGGPLPMPDDPTPGGDMSGAGGAPSSGSGGTSPGLGIDGPLPGADSSADPMTPAAAGGQTASSNPSSEGAAAAAAASDPTLLPPSVAGDTAGCACRMNSQRGSAAGQVLLGALAVAWLGRRRPRRR